MTYLEIMKKALDYYINEPYNKKFNQFWQNDYYLESKENKPKIKQEYKDLQTYLIFKTLYSKKLLTKEQINKFNYFQSCTS